MELTQDQIEDFEERSAIIEYDGGFSKEEAEEKALKIIKGQIKGQRELL